MTNLTVLPFPVPLSCFARWLTPPTPQVHPLRIAKQTTPSSSPAKMTSGLPRPLSEISPTEKRRNSPSWRHCPSSKVSVGARRPPPPARLTPPLALQVPVAGNDSSPFQSSPLDSAPSPRLFWQNRSAENMVPAGPASSPTRRSSIERLQRASRVRNSNILALEQKHEYDPTRLPHLERPLAKVQPAAVASPSSSGGLRSSDSDEHALDSKSSLSTMSPSKASPILSSNAQVAPNTPTRGQASPIKSSLSPTKLNKGTFDPESDAWSVHSSFHEHELPDGRFLHRHPKSVTFDAAPPQINEYEMATPDLSSIGTNSREGSYESAGDEDDDEDGVLYDPVHGDLHDDSFDESLEDTDKTPVVGPDDWRGDSPVVPPSAVSGQYEGSPASEGVPSGARARPSHQRSDSANSNGDHRPLPPLPGLGHARSQSTGSASASTGLSATAERMLGAHRSLPVPPPASATKSDIQSFGNGKMTLEERLKLMMLSDDGNAKSVAEQQRERRLRRGAGRDRADTPQSEPEAEDHDAVVGDGSLLDDYQMPPRISRESIMRRFNGNEALEHAAEHQSSYPAGTADRGSHVHDPPDPDVPIPTTEDPAMHEALLQDDDEGSVIVTRDDEEQVERVVDYAEADAGGDYDQAGDDESHYSDNEPSPERPESKDVDAELTTPRARSPAQRPLLNEPVPDLAPAALAAGMNQAVAGDKADDAVHKADPPGTPPRLARPHTPEKQMSMPDYDGSGWGDPDNEFDHEPATPDSVIHHPAPADEEEPRLSPAIPERIATVRSASGSKLKTRASSTPSDLATMREARRQFSQEVPAVPPIPERHRNRVSRDMAPAAEEGAPGEPLQRNSSFKNRSLTLDLDMGLSLEQDFERVIEAQKVHHRPPLVEPTPVTAASGPRRQVSGGMAGGEPGRSDTSMSRGSQRGYLMRQNTKLVTASDKDADSSWKTRSANNSPVKHERPQSWVIEPWDGELRQRFARKRPGTAGGIPPLPGQESNAAVVNHVAEDDSHSEAATMDNVERGRLFVKVLGVKDLDLPLPRSRCPPQLPLSHARAQLTRDSDERTWFSLTLDNGVHCVTTAWLEIARNAPIGQEFELVVPNDLEFQLTFNVKLDKPARSSVPVEVAKVVKPKTSTFSRVFASPRKRRELEMRQKADEERFAQQQREAMARRNHSPTGYELLSPLAAEDGSFARAYVCLKEHEGRCFGRPLTTEVLLFNEWATEEESFASSVKSKRGNTAVVRRAPYQIGKLELQLLFVPRPKNAKDEDMPKSMNSCIRKLKAAEERLARSWEGHLSQQGGDCPVRATARRWARARRC